MAWREEAFRTFLAPRLGRNSASSYLSNLRAAVQLLGIDLDRDDLHEPAIELLHRRLLATGMNAARASDCRSALRQYAAFRRDPSPSPPPPPPAAPARPLAQHGERDLLSLYAGVLEELRARGTIRSANAPVGDYAGTLCARAFGWTLQPKSRAAYDAQDAAGTRYQIKARRVGAHNPSRQLGAIRRLDEAGFDLLAAILFTPDITVQRAALVPHAVVARLARKVEHTNSWRFLLTDGTWLEPEVHDITPALRKAQESHS